MPGLGIIAAIKVLWAAKGVAGALFKIGLSMALSVGAGLVQKLLTPRPKPLEGLDGPKHTIRSEIVNARWVVGKKVRVPGVLCYFGSRDRTARMALIISEGACNKIDGKMWVDGKLVGLTRTPNPNGDLLTPTYGKYRDHLKIREYFKADGAQGTHMRTTASTAGQQEYSYDFGATWVETTPTEYFDERESLGDVPIDPTDVMSRPAGGQAAPWRTPFPEWTDKHKLKGVSWVYVEMTQPDYGQDLSKRLFTKIPNLEFLVDGVKITFPDPSTGAAAGSMKTESSENAAAVRYWWETVRRGRGAAEINVEEFKTAYNACEQMVDVAAGLPASHAEFRSFANAKRYTINGVVSAGDDVSSVEDQMDAAWAGEVIEVGGKLRFRPGVMRPTTAELDLDHHLADKDVIEPPSVRPWAALQQRVNAVDAEIGQSAAHGWTRLSLPKYRDQAAFERDGQERGGSIRLAYVTNPIAAGRLQAVNLRRARESLRMEVAVTPGGNFERLSLIPTDVVAVSSSEYGFANKRMEIERVAVREDWSVALTLREVVDGTYDNTLVLPKLKPRVISLPDERTVPDVDGLAADEVAETGRDGAILIQLHVSWTAAAVRETEVEVREKPAADAAEEPAWQSGVSVGNRFRYPNVADGKTYQVRARHWNRHGYAGAWAEMERTVSGDVEPPAAPTNLEVFSAPEGIRATWENPEDGDWWAACVYIGTTNTFDENTLAATLSADVYEAGGWTAGTTYYVWVRAKDTSGNLGPTVGPEEVTPTALADETAKIFNGTGAPDDTASTKGSKDGDLYIQDDGTVWKKADGAWTSTGIDLSGVDGAKIHTYSGEIPDGEESLTPPDTITDPAVGDIAIHTDSGHWYERTATGWELQGDLTGPPGPKGASVLHWPQDTDPLATFGVVGDITIRPDGVWYEKTEDGWQKRGDLTGEPGTKIFNGDVAKDAAPTETGENVGDVFVATDGRWWEWDGSAWQFRSSMAGKDGPGVELIYRRTTEDTAPDTPTLPQDQQQQDDQTPEGWTDDPKGVDADNPYEWVSERRRNSDEVWSAFSAPGKWAVYIPGKDGPGLELVFRQTTEDTAPTTPTLPQDQQQQDDQVPTGWSDDPQGVDADNPHEWVSRRKRNSEGVWSAFSPPRKWAVYIPGKDGPGVEFVFRRTTEDTAPTTPTLPQAQQQQADQVPTDWSDDPVSVDADNPYQWVSRRKRNSEGVWGPFSTPQKWTVPGEQGEQGERGEQGKQGETGPAGQQGPPGREGPQGPDGPVGDPGPKGQPGEQGPPGPQGDPGDKGIKGEPGEQGNPGEKGDVGEQGFKGEPGEQGDPGEKGGLGDSGAKGEPGTQGNPGAPGGPGSQGDPGAKGLPGAAGQPGQAGDQVFVYYTNAPSSEAPSNLTPVSLLADGRWTTSGGTYHWYPDATQVPD